MLGNVCYFFVVRGFFFQKELSGMPDQSVKQLGSRSGLTLFEACSGYTLFAQVNY